MSKPFIDKGFKDSVTDLNWIAQKFVNEEVFILVS